MIVEEHDYLVHYGILRRSGRYPWGSSQSENVRNRSFLEFLSGLRGKGMSDKEIADSYGFSTTELRAANTIATNQQRQWKIKQIERMADKGMSNVAIGQRLGIPESTVRSLQKPGAADRANKITNTAERLKAEVADKKYIDVGKGTSNHLGVTDNTLKAAVAIAMEEGYVKRYIKVKQLGTGNETTIQVLAAPGTPWAEVNSNRDKIATLAKMTDTYGADTYDVGPPLSISSKRVGVVYGPDGGAKADGVIYVRPGVEDVSLGKNRYAQVRVKVDDTHYLKGMAVYKDDLPDGVDLQFNTNKSDTGKKLDAFKPLKDDPDSPFGATFDQIGPVVNGKKQPTSSMNLVNEQGDWNEWSRTLSSQMLSKQSPKLAREQLDMVYERKTGELNEILSMTNPTVRRKLLQEYADGADASAVHLKAAALPRQKTQVILPINSLKDNEVYAPNFDNGETLALVRYPHGGTFEIPILTVNNKNREGRKIIGTDTEDALGINARVAERLSGADFDGDTVIAIPNGGPGRKGKVTSTPALEGLKNFDPRAEYAAYPGMRKITNKTMQGEMGKVSNLITDMTIKLAPPDEIARAVRHSMVVIDAEKHNLDYKASSIQNGIPALKEKYQGRKNAGATTIVSLATSETRVPVRKPRPAADGGPIDKKTGKLVFVETGEVYTDRSGNVQQKKFKTERLAIEDDAFKLSSGTPIETEYARHSNRMKDLANQARLEMINTPLAKQNRSAKETYKAETQSLNAKLDLAERNAPLERKAQLIANEVVNAKRAANPDLSSDQIKREEARALSVARNRTGARKQRIEITDKEWTAIQAGAISDTNLSSILASADMDRVRDLATPRAKVAMTSAKTLRAQRMLDRGYTRAEVAGALGVSLSTLDEVTEVGNG